MGGCALGCRRRMTGEESRGSSGCRGTAVGSVLRWWWCAVRTRCARAQLLALGRCARSQVWQPWAASLFAVFPAPRWSSVSTPERHRHAGRSVCARDALPGAPRAPGPSGNRSVWGYRVSGWCTGFPGAPGGPGRPGLEESRTEGLALSGSWFVGRLVVSAGCAGQVRWVGGSG